VALHCTTVPKKESVTNWLCLLLTALVLYAQYSGIGQEEVDPLVRGKYAVGTGTVGPTGSATPSGDAQTPWAAPVQWAQGLMHLQTHDDHRQQAH